MERKQKNLGAKKEGKNNWKGNKKPRRNNKEGKYNWKGNKKPKRNNKEGQNNWKENKKTEAQQYGRK